MTNAALGVGCWRKALDEFAHANKSSRAQLYGVDGEKRLVNYWVNDMNPKAYQDFIEIDGDNPIRNPRWKAAEFGRELEALGDEFYDLHRPKLADRDYLDFAEKWEMPFGAQAALVKQKSYSAHILLLRTRNEQKTTAEDLVRFQEMIPFVLNALQLAMNLGNLKVSSEICAIESLEVAAFICDTLGRVIESTKEGAKFFSSQEYLTLNNGYLHGIGNDNQAAIDKAMKKILVGEATSASAVLLSVQNNQHLILDFHKLPKFEHDFYHYPHIIISLRNKKCVTSPEELQIAYDLSLSEAEVAIAIANGTSRGELAQTRGVTVETIRSQIKSIFAKLGVNREMELAHKIR